jgi:Ribbon-helix-helix protein, copG family
MTTLASSSPSDSLKINARLGANAAAQLNALTRKTGLGISEIVRLSLNHYHQAVMTDKIPPSKIVAAAGKYASSGEDSGRLSTEYKRLFGEGIAKKYGLTAKAPAQAASPAKKKAR